MLTLPLALSKGSGAESGGQQLSFLTKAGSRRESTGLVFPQQNTAS